MTAPYGSLQRRPRACVPGTALTGQVPSAQCRRRRGCRRARGARAGDGSRQGPKHHGKKGGDPSPIPGGFLIGSDGSFSLAPTDPTIHVLPPAVGFEMSTITDFDGVVGAAEIQGTARDNNGGAYWFDCDMRFMKGRYIDVDGRKRENVFGFV